MGYVQEDWHEHYASGKSFAALGDGERVLLAEHAPAPEDGRALDVGRGTGELAVHLESLGYRVDACDFAPNALERAREGHPDAGARWLSLDVEHEDLAPLSKDGYDLVVLRLVAAILGLFAHLCTLGH
ncbi:class I SAM-dependent methyltransferase [Streptomyces virginiae]|uniref:class I SAM-dependent methyltransferase n=1 Tax=Streptomyces virginiae TaxID=1961 RepID=UPI0036EF488A